MGKWNSSPHPISDVRDWQAAGRLEIRPDFQRRAVWSDSARIMLIDTILRDVPMPKIFLWNEIRQNSTHRRVIDGQQRLNAILAFMEDKFSLNRPYEGEFQYLTYSQLPDDVRNKFLQYKIDFNEAVDFSEVEVREVYSRVNKYSLPLNQQELRQADYPGDFLELCLNLSQDEYLDESRIFSPANKRRMGDVEYVSELLAAMLAGPQDKKEDLDTFYYRYKIWNKEDMEKTREEFISALSDLKFIFLAPDFELRSTRFRQKADFYSLFSAVVELRRMGGSLDGHDLGPLRQDLRILHKYIAPESEVGMLSEYAIKCVSQANSASSRAWRRDFLMNLLSGTYKARRPIGRSLAQISELARQLIEVEDTSLFDVCPECKVFLHKEVPEEEQLYWPDIANTYQISNAGWMCDSCSQSKKQ